MNRFAVFLGAVWSAGVCVAAQVEASSPTYLATVDTTVGGDVVALDNVTNLLDFAWNSAADWARGGSEEDVVLSVQPYAGDPADRSTWAAAGAATELVNAAGEGVVAFVPDKARIFRVTLVGEGIDTEVFLDLTAASGLVQPISLAGATVAFAGNPFSCTGAPIVPAPDVTLGGTPLVQGTDFVCSYFGNVRPGTATVVLSGMGDYGGNVSGSFTILPVQATTAASAAPVAANLDTLDEAARAPESVDLIFPLAWNSSTDWTAGGKSSASAVVAVVAQTGSSGDPATWSDAGGPQVVTNEVGEGVVAWLPAKAGYYKATLSTGNVCVAVAYFDLTGTAGLSSGTPIDDFALELAVVSVPCDGHLATPEVTVSNGTSVLVKDVDYTVEYTDNLYVGTATVTVHGIGEYSGSISRTFAIVSVDPVEVASATKGGVAFDSRTDIPRQLRNSGELMPMTWNSSETAPAQDGYVQMSFAEWLPGGDTGRVARLSVAKLVDGVEGDWRILGESSNGVRRVRLGQGLWRAKMEVSADASHAAVAVTNDINVLYGGAVIIVK